MRIKIQMKEKKRRKKGGEEKKAMVTLLVFILVTLEIWPKEMPDGRGLFGVSVFKLIRLDIFFSLLRSNEQGIQ